MVLKPFPPEFEKEMFGNMKICMNCTWYNSMEEVPANEDAPKYYGDKMAPCGRCPTKPYVQSHAKACGEFERS